MRICWFCSSSCCPKLVNSVIILLITNYNSICFPWLPIPKLLSNLSIISISALCKMIYHIRSLLFTLQMAPCLPILAKIWSIIVLLPAYKDLSKIKTKKLCSIHHCQKEMHPIVRGNYFFKIQHDKDQILGLKNGKKTMVLWGTGVKKKRKVKDFCLVMRKRYQKIGFKISHPPPIYILSWADPVHLCENKVKTGLASFCTIIITKKHKIMIKYQ